MYKDKEINYYIGKRFPSSNLVAREYVGEVKGHHVFLAKCTCSNYIKVTGRMLEQGKVKTCGTCY